MNKQNIFLTTLVVLSMFFIFIAGNSLAATVSTCQTISVSGVYDVNQTLIPTGDNCINITVDDVILDLHGNIINGSKLNADYGVFVNGTTNVTIRNGTMHNLTAGIYAQNSATMIITNLTILNTTNAISFLNVSTSTLTTITGQNNAIDIFMNASTGNDITQSTFTSSTTSTLSLISSSTNNDFSYITVTPIQTVFDLDDYAGDFNLSMVSTLSAPSGALAGYANITRFLNISGSNWVEVLLRYNNSNVYNIVETTLLGYRWNATNWTTANVTSTRHINANTINLNISDFSPIGVFGTGQTCGNVATDLTLQTNLYIAGASCLKVTADDLTIDCNGFSIIGDLTDFTAAINMTGRDNITIQNCVLNSFTYGVFVNGTNNSVVNNNTMLNTNYSAYMTGNSDSDNITQNKMTIVNHSGIYVTNTTNSRFSRNTITTCDYGINLQGTDNANNTFNSNVVVGAGTFDLHIDYSPSRNYFNSNTIGILNPTTFSILNYNGSPHMHAIETPAADPTGKIDISKFLNITETNGNWMQIRINYTNADVVVGGAIENTLRLYHYNGTNWSMLTSNVNKFNDFVAANISNYSQFGLFGTLRTAPQTVYGGSSGGSSTTVTPDFDMDITLVKKLRKTDFFFFDLKTEKHKFTLQNIDGVAGEATVTIASTPKDYVLGLGKITNIDVDGDGAYDITATLNDIEYGTVTITIEKYRTAFIPRPTMPQTQETQETKPQQKQTQQTQQQMPERQQMAPQIEKKGTSWYWWVGIAIIAIILIIWIANSMKGTKPTKRKHKKR